MSIDSRWLGLAAVLLWAPSLLPKELALRLANGWSWPETSVAGLLSAWMNWLDFLRAGAGTYVLTQLSISIDPSIRGVSSKALMCKGAILLVGVIIQVVRYKNEVVFLTPVLYLSGVTLILPGDWKEGGFAVFVGWLFAIMGKNPVYQLPVMAAALGIGAYVLGGITDGYVLLNIALILLTPVLNVLFHKPPLFIARQPSVQA